MAAGFDFDQIADDDWEAQEVDADDEEHPPTRSHSDGSEVRIPANHDSLVIEDPREENDPNPFHLEVQQIEPVSGPEMAHPHLAVYLLYLLVTWLHTQFHLPFRACQAVLVVVGLALRYTLRTASANPQADFNPPLLTTLPSVMYCLGVDPCIRVLPVCPKCQEVYASTIPKNAICDCGETIFKLAFTPNSQRRAREDPKPRLQFPMKTISEHLVEMLSVSEIEKEMESVYEKFSSHQPGQYRNIFDGKVCRELPSRYCNTFPNVQGIIPHRPAGELRIGVTMGVDWFSYLRSQISQSHTSCLMSFSVVNLPPHLRYRTANLMLAGIMPGPKEATPDQVQRYMRPFVNELLTLWKDGIRIVTPQYPQGRLVRVALVALVCDKPAAHKLGGFGSHCHTNFCTVCWITQNDKSTPQAFEKGAFRPRTNAEHHRLQKEYLRCKTKSAQDTFVRDNATRWSELFRLPYFDVCEMIVIDPMHNLFLGLVKTHFYHIWVQHGILRKNKELKALHGMLSQLTLPSKLGRLPRLIGEPAGGSLTADQWLIFATIVAPLAIPQLWQDYLPSDPPDVVAGRRASAILANLEARRAAAAAARAASLDNVADDTAATGEGHVEVEEQLARKGNSKKNESRFEAPDSPVSNLHPNDPANFLKLATALVLFTARSLNDEEVERADILIREYCVELIELYGPSVIRPNHHYATHTASNIRNYGPLHEFWTFLFERLNRVLKSYNTANHSGGELEVSFFREFDRTVQHSRLVGFSPCVVRCCRLNSYLYEAVGAMYDASANDRGTLQALTRELDNTFEDGGVHFQFSSRSERVNLLSTVYFALLKYLQERNPTIHIHSKLQLAPVPGSLPLSQMVLSFNYIVVNQKRYTAASRSTTTSDSLILVRSSPNTLWAGRLEQIFKLQHPGIVAEYLGHVRWFVPADISLAGTVWESL
ncbi:hypothetical protein K435DRAFT_680238 [Dendrothele bispora CBS 962.96]|uniref:Transposase domain-containing protein n=1 Tax=Dendrothele bispora (strain CBS 962.96) TaxID=1314807 RepID=A0A4S8LGN9_DENBC|nr:hypothetical protein K435DRAFT_680238 [Dendrothele bispora CBS 962.96]